MRGQPIVDAKISKPPPHRWAPRRARARALLDEGDRVGLTVVAAGPGYMKRELVEAWATIDPRRRVAWLSLDEADDPIRLVAHVLAAVRSVAPGFAPEIVLDDLVGEGDWHARVADTVVAALGSLDGPLVLVLEGVHRLVDGGARRGVETLIRYRPPQLHLVVVTRDDAAVDLAHATMSGSLVEIRESDLVLDVDGTYRVLAAAGLEATMDDARALRADTGGWPAGVVLAATRHRPDGGLEPFAPEQDPVQSFLRNRVLGALDDDLATVFLQIAPLGSVHADLVAHVTERPDAGRMLDRLSELHLLFDAPGLGPGWRAFPDPLRRFAHHEHRGRGGDEARTLYRKAATWCWERELLEESLTIAAYSEDPELLATILLEHHLPWSAEGHAERVRAWCAVLLQVDPERVEALLAAAWASLLLGDEQVAASTLALLDARETSGDRGLVIRGEVAVLRSHLARRRGDMGAGLTFAREGAAAAAQLPPMVTSIYHGALPSNAALHVGFAALWAGELDEAVACLEESRSTWGWASLALPLFHSYLALAHWLRGDEAALAHATVAATRLGEERLGAGDYVALVMGSILDVGDLGATGLDRIVALAAEIDEPVTRVLAASAEAIRMAEQDPSRARAAVRRGRSEADACQDAGVLHAVMAKTAFVAGIDHIVTPGEPLTGGEQRVLEMLAGPLTEREIAAELHLSHNTVRTYRRRLYGKLGLRSRADVGLAIESRQRDPD